jgi:glucosamine-6-phosphate deaminase
MTEAVSGFSWGGIGPDGHIAFNMADEPLDLPTHLTRLNYKSAASAAVDLGWIANARDKVVMTIGGGTIQKGLSSSAAARAVILAAGRKRRPLLPLQSPIYKTPNVLDQC